MAVAQLSFPTGREYQDALQDTSFCFKHPDIARGQPALDQLGMPKAISGNFATVFQVDGTDERTWAIKCFTRNVQDQARRYEMISAALAGMRAPWVVGFDYLAEGVRCNGRWLPVLKMEWVQGIGLIPYLEAHLWDTADIAALAHRFAGIVTDLTRARISHGDLQHGNLLVTPSRELKLVDYDGMFVPALADAGAIERDHQNYQSPARDAQWGPDLDNFSAWIIYVSLVALTIDPTLWSRVRSTGEEALLFRKEDFENPASSRALMELETSSVDDLVALAQHVSKLSALPFGDIPALNPAELPEPCSASPLLSISGATSSDPLPVASAGIPEWMAGPPPLPGRPAGAGWISGHLPAPSPVAFTGSPGLVQLLEAATLAAVMVLGLLMLGVVIPADAAAAVAIVILGSFFVATALSFHATREWRTKSERRAVVVERSAVLTRARQVAKGLSDARHQLDLTERRAYEAVSERMQKVKEADTKERASVAQEEAARASETARRRQDLLAREAAELGNALRIVQEEHVKASLAASFPGSAGLSRSDIEGLRSHGVSTAADFIGVSVSSGVSRGFYRAANVAYIHLPNGSKIHVYGIGPVKARTLETWRRKVEAAAQASRPARLPATREQDIRNNHARQLQAMGAVERLATTEAAGRRAAIDRKFQATQSALLSELEATRQDAARGRAKMDSEIVRAQRAISDAEWPVLAAERELAAYARITYVRYLLRGLRA